MAVCRILIDRDKINSFEESYLETAREFLIDDTKFKKYVGKGVKYQVEINYPSHIPEFLISLGIDFAKRYLEEELKK